MSEHLAESSAATAEEVLSADPAPPLSLMLLPICSPGEGPRAGVGGRTPWGARPALSDAACGTGAAAGATPAGSSACLRLLESLLRSDDVTYRASALKCPASVGCLLERPDFSFLEAYPVMRLSRSQWRSNLLSTIRCIRHRSASQLGRLRSLGRCVIADQRASGFNQWSAARYPSFILMSGSRAWNGITKSGLRKSL